MPTLVEFGHDISGPTTARPTNVDAGCVFLDTTTGVPWVYDGTNWLPFAGKFPVQTNATGPVTVSVADSGKWFSTVGAAGAVTFALPAAVVGLKYGFRVGAAQELRIDPNGTETISLPSSGVPGAAGKYLTADAIGETVLLVCVVAGTWSVAGYTGTWTAEA